MENKECEIWVNSILNKNYQVSDLGNIRSLNYRRTGKVKNLMPSLNSSGYLSVVFSNNGKLKCHHIHVLVAIAFLNHKPNGHELVVNHKDLNRLNNNLYNLEIITNRKNCDKKHIASTSKYTGVFKHKYGFISQITLNRKTKYLGFFKDELEASNAYGKEIERITTKN